MLINVIPKWLLGAWFTAVAAIVASSIRMSVRLSTSVVLLIIGVAPAVIMYLIQAGAAPPTVAEILYTATNARDDQS
jgi:predicted membrane protein